MSIKRKLNEAADPVAKIQSLIQQVNDAYHNADNEQGGTEWPLMDKDGSPYGLSSDIRLDSRGYVIIPFTAWQYSDYSKPVKIRVLRKVGGKIKIIPGDYYEEGWKDVSKLLKKIIKDANIGVGHFKEYDPNWENSDSKEEQMANRSLLKAMNKKIGRNTNAGVDYLSENKSKLKTIINEAVKQVLKETSYDLARKAHKSAIQQGKYDQAERLHKHMVDRSSQRFDPNMPVIIVGGDKQGRYTAQDIIDNFDIDGYVEPSQNPIYTDSQLIGYPKIKGYIGPMWDGEKIRYESQDAYDFYSK